MARKPTAKELAEGGSWEDLERELLADPETRAAAEELEPRYELARKMIALRAGAGLSQRELAERVGMSQSVIARLESGKVSPTWETIQKVVAATGGEVVFKARQGKRLVAV